MISSELKKIPFFDFYFEDLDLSNPKTKKKLEKCDLTEDVYYEPIFTFSNKYFDIRELTTQETNECLARMKNLCFLGNIAEQKVENVLKSEIEFVCFYVSDLKKEKRFFLRHNYGCLKYLWNFKILKIPIFVIAENNIIAGKL